MLYVIVITIIAGALLKISIDNKRRIFKERVKEVLKSNFHAPQYITPEISTSLPQPVANYFAAVLPQNCPVIKTARLRQDGYFRTGLDKEWITIKGEQYISGISPRFVWKGETQMFTAIDSYSNGVGNLSVWLLSALRIADKKGKDIDDAEIIRWIAESALVPTNLLPSDSLKWEELNAVTAKLHYFFKEREYSLLVRFNACNEIESVETIRPFNDKSLQKWKGRFRSYKNIEGYRVPTELEAIWIIDEEEKPYAMFSITDINFNCPYPF
jgi:hypothetical protein